MNPILHSPARSLLRRVFAVVVVSLTLLTRAGAAEDPIISAVRAADDERIAATMAGHRARLAAVYSDQLHYGHSSGKIDTKASQIAGIVDGPNRYTGFEHKERTFVPAGPGVVLMKGRVIMRIAPKNGSEPIVNDLNYLAVWREEKGAWRFLAWQSCKNPPATGAAK